jgi:hypothetical protein
MHAVGIMACMVGTLQQLCSTTAVYISIQPCVNNQPPTAAAEVVSICSAGLFILQAHFGLH